MSLLSEFLYMTISYLSFGITASNLSFDITGSNLIEVALGSTSGILAVLSYSTLIYFDRPRKAHMVPAIGLIALTLLIVVAATLHNQRK